jgi:hypothetical protein
MLAWLRKYNKTLNFFGGLIILSLTLVLYFWSAPKEVAVAGKSKSEKRVERTHTNSNMIVRKKKERKDMSKFSEKLKDGHQAKQFLLMMMFLGFGMLIYSLYSKFTQKKS